MQFAWQLWRWVTDPSPGSVRMLAVICGLGLLTKATFVAVVPVVAVLLGLIGRRFDRATAG
jgi:4-amino-4-deoxy-L-arabinose transferase-like glycosyltransferase